MTGGVSHPFEDFLLARIADDQDAALAQTRDAWRDKHWSSPDSRTGWMLVLAECEARRDLINHHLEAVSAELEPGVVRVYDDVLHRLALSYDGHPDYRREWGFDDATPHGSWGLLLDRA